MTLIFWTDAGLAQDKSIETLQRVNFGEWPTSLLPYIYWNTYLPDTDWNIDTLQLVSERLTYSFEKQSDYLIWMYGGWLGYRVGFLPPAHCGRINSKKIFELCRRGDGQLEIYLKRFAEKKNISTYENSKVQVDAAYYQALADQLQKAPKDWQNLGSVLTEALSYCHQTTDPITPLASDPRSVQEACRLMRSKTWYGCDGAGADFGYALQESTRGAIHEMLRQKTHWQELANTLLEAATEESSRADSEALKQKMLLLQAAYDNELLTGSLIRPLSRVISPASANQKFKDVFTAYRNQAEYEKEYTENQEPHAYDLITQLTRETIKWTGCIQRVSAADEEASFRNDMRRQLQETLAFETADLVKQVVSQPDLTHRNFDAAEKMSLSYPEAYIAARRQFKVPLSATEAQAFLIKAVAAQEHSLWDQITDWSDIEENFGSDVYFKTLNQVVQKYVDSFQKFISTLPDVLTEEEVVKALDAWDSGDSTELTQDLEDRKMEVAIDGGHYMLASDLLVATIYKTGLGCYTIQINFTNPVDHNSYQLEFTTALRITYVTHTSLERKLSRYLINGIPVSPIELKKINQLLPPPPKQDLP